MEATCGGSLQSPPMSAKKNMWNAVEKDSRDFLNPIK